MSIRGSVVGFVTKSEIMTPQEPTKKQFLLIELESRNKFTKWPSRTKVMIYGKDLEAKQAEYPIGSLVRAEGDVSADAYISKKNGKAMASVRIYASMVDQIDISRSGDSEGQPPQQGAKPEWKRPQAPNPPPQQASAEEDGDVPF